MFLFLFLYTVYGLKKKKEMANKDFETSQIAKFMGPTWGPPGSCPPQMDPMLVPWTLLSGLHKHGLAKPALRFRHG